MKRSSRLRRAISMLPAFVILLAGTAASGVSAQTLRNDQSADPPPVSICQAIARTPTLDNVVSLANDALSREQVRISFVGHSTYYIETPEGTSIATDYNGFIGTQPTPNVATMNKAHSSHYTLFPDPDIEYVLPGWNPDGGPADHDLLVGDTYIRNVTTDIRAGFAGAEPDANSIFIFEVAGLCIGHLGHLHHKLEDKHIAQIGRLDVVMVPVDGGLTLGHESMSETIKRLRASVILPMHRRGRAISQFISMFGEDFDRLFIDDDSMIVSLRTLPKQPTIVVLNGV